MYSASIIFSLALLIQHMTLSLIQGYSTFILAQISLLSILIICTQLQHIHTQSDSPLPPPPPSISRKTNNKNRKKTKKTIQCKGQEIKTIQSTPKIKAKMHPPKKKSTVKKNKKTKQNQKKTNKKKKKKKPQQQTEVCNNFSLT